MNRIIYLTIVFVLFQGLYVCDNAYAKVKLPFGITAALLNDPQKDGVAEIEVKASSLSPLALELECVHKNLTIIEGESPIVFSLKAGETKTFKYRLSLPKPDAPYDIVFTIRLQEGKQRVRTIVHVNKPLFKPAGRISKDKSGQGVRELGP